MPRPLPLFPVILWVDRHEKIEETVNISLVSFPGQSVLFLK